MWADVGIPELSGRDLTAVERAALFFIPSAYQRIKDASLNAHRLVLKGDGLKNAGRKQDAAGRAIVDAVLDCMPVALESARRFIVTANAALDDVVAAEPPAKFVREDIVACVFRLKDINDLVAGLSLSAADIAAGSGAPEKIVASALNRHRISLRHAMAIRHYFMKLMSEKPTPEEAALFRWCTGKAEDFIRLDLDHNLSVETYDITSEDGRVRTRSVYESRGSDPR